MKSNSLGRRLEVVVFREKSVKPSSRSRALALVIHCFGMEEK